MVIPTMNDDDKAFEAFRIYPIAKEVYDEYKDIIMDKFARGTKFPYFQRVVFDDDRHNKWTMTFLCKSKADKKKGRFGVLCHTAYEIQKRRSDGTGKFDGNTGKGILAFDPIGLWQRAKFGNGDCFSMIIDIVPHAFNRYSERYLNPNGKTNMEFQRKVESIMLRWRHFDVLGDESSDKHGKYPYDVFMVGGGVLRGQLVNDILVRFFTYVSDDMFYDCQKERQDKMTKEYYHWKNEGKFSNKVISYEKL